MPMVRAHVIFSGRVQGVGFRYTAQRLACDLKLTGWVKNLPDQRVELMAEGPRETAEHFIFKLEGLFQITQKDMDWLPARQDYNDFLVTY